MHLKLFQIVILVCCVAVSSSLFAQQGIGTENPNKSAALEIESSSRGLLIPRVSLQNITDGTTIRDGNIESLLVYNINSQNDMIPGYYYWSASENKWMKLLVEGDDFGNQNENSWLEQLTNDPAILNNQNIYQEGNIAIGKTDDFLNVPLDVFGSIRGGNPADGSFGENSIAVGDSVIASGNNSVAFGYQSEATSFGAFAGGGYKATIPNSNNFSFSKGGKAFGKASFAFGNQTEAEGDYAVAMGRETQALKTGAVAFGRDTKAEGSYSFAMGRKVKARAYETVFGRFNAIQDGNLVQWNENDPLFQIGNGTSPISANRSNALTILKKGWMGIGIEASDNLAKPTETLDVGSGNVRIRDLPETNGNLSEDRIIVVQTSASNNQKGILKSIDPSDLKSTGPWFIQSTTNPATENDQDIYQYGKVAINKNTHFLDAALDVEGAIRGGHQGQSGNTTIIGEHSIGVGEMVVAKEKYTAAFGYKSEATAEGAFAAGGDSSHPGGKASGISSFAFGWGSKAKGDYSFAFGRSNIASGLGAFAIGRSSKAAGDYSFAMGHKIASDTTKAIGHYGFAFGRGAEVHGKQSFAFGLRVKALNDHEFVFGKYNAIQNDPDTRFQLADGSSGTAKNLLTVLKDGKTGIGIIGTETNAKPTEMLDIGSGKVKIRDLPMTTGGTGNKYVVVDQEGVLRSTNASPSPLPLINSSLTENKSKMSKFFPTTKVFMPLTENAEVDYDFEYYNGVYTINLFQIYRNEYEMSKNNSISSEPNHQIFSFSADQLIYNITFYDREAFTDLSLSSLGQLNYKVSSEINENSKTYMNLVFEVKD